MRFRARVDLDLLSQCSARSARRKEILHLPIAVEDSLKPGTLDDTTWLRPGHFIWIVAAQPALLAHHCEEAGLTEKAIEYWLAAGRQAWGRSATAEAVALLHRGLALVPALPDGDWRRETELDLRITLGQAVIMNRSWGAPELGEVYSRARELASRLKRPHALLFALWGQFTDHWAQADLKRARRLAAELQELGDTAGDVPT
jgi:hypothetical protein